jgi:arylsulfatase A-like enzyme
MQNKRPQSENHRASGQTANNSGNQIGRRDFVKSAVVGGGAVALACALGNNPLEARGVKRPNIVFVFDDQYRQDMNKFIPTPHADRLAREGITFPNMISTTPLCTPFRGMLMTGRYPTHSGIVLNFVEANPNQNPHCLANMFDRAGYNTAFIGKWHLAAGYRIPDGLFKYQAELERAYRESHPNTEYVPPGPERLGFRFWQAYNFHADYHHYWFYEDRPQKIYSKKYETDTNFDQAIDYIEKHKGQGNPFLLVVAPHPPHPPWSPESPPEGYLAKVPEARDLYHSPNVPKENNPMKPESLRSYLAMAKNFDDNLGRLMDYLDRSGIGDNTILVFTSDHGEMAGSHGRLNKMVPYTEAANVPLKMRWPGKIPAGVVSDALFTPIDFLPTLCGFAGVKPPSESDGQDLSDIALGRGRSYREAVLMANYTSHWDFFQTETLWPEWRGVHTKRYTYVKWLTGREELYDNLEDPFQMRDLAGEGSAKQTLLELRWRLKELMTYAHDDFLNGRQYASWYDDRRNLIRTALGPVPC